MHGGDFRGVTMIFVSMDARSAAVYWVLLVVQWLLCSIYLFFFPLWLQTILQPSLCVSRKQRCRAAQPGRKQQGNDAAAGAGSGDKRQCTHTCSLQPPPDVCTKEAVVGEARSSSVHCPAPLTPSPGAQWVPTPAASQGAVLTHGKRCKKAIHSAENLKQWSPSSSIPTTPWAPLPKMKELG